jgi:hypothetical protein
MLNLAIFYLSELSISKKSSYKILGYTANLYTGSEKNICEHIILLT